MSSSIPDIQIVSVRSRPNTMRVTPVAAAPKSLVTTDLQRSPTERMREAKLGDRETFITPELCIEAPLSTEEGFPVSVAKFHTLKHHSCVHRPGSLSNEGCPLCLGKTSDLRKKRIEEFLMARSLSQASQRAYEQDLKRFLDWTDCSWEEVTPRQIAQFKKYLMRNDPDSGKRVLSDSTCCRTLTTLKNFYGWMFRCRYISHDPSIEVDKPKLKEPTAQNLRDEEIELIYQAVLSSSLPERNIALVSVLLHGLRASEVTVLNIEDYDRNGLTIRQAKADSKGAGQTHLNFTKVCWQ